MTAVKFVARQCAMGMLVAALSFIVDRFTLLRASIELQINGAVRDSTGAVVPHAVIR